MNVTCEESMSQSRAPERRTWMVPREELAQWRSILKPHEQREPNGQSRDLPRDTVWFLMLG